MTVSTEGKIKMMKGVVFFMSVIMVMGIGLVVYGLTYGKKTKDNSSLVQEVSSHPGASSGTIGSFESITLKSETPITVKSMVSCGNMLCINVDNGQEENVIIINPQSGKIVGTINLIVEKR